MRMTYRFHGAPQLARLSLEVESTATELRVRASGPGALRYAGHTRFYFASLKRMRPIAILEDGSRILSLYYPPVPSAAHARVFEDYLRTWVLHDRAPVAVTIGVTHACQCTCVHCSAGGMNAGGNGRAAQLTTAEMRRVVAESVDIGVANVTFTGGEPLLRPDLDELVAAVPADKAVAQVFTNALLLDADRTAELKAAGLHAAQMSLDAPDADEHDALRGVAGAFDAVRQGVRHARAAGLFVGLSTYATNESVRAGHLTRIAALAAQWGVHELTVFDVLPAGRLLGRTDLLLTDGSRRLLLDEAAALNRRFGGRPHVITQAWTNCGRGFARLIGCLAGNCQFHVTASGDFAPCDFTPLAIGNVRRESVGELWRRTVEHPAYRKHSNACRMQSAAFRARYIDPIPEGAPLPYPIDELPPV